MSSTVSINTVGTETIVVPIVGTAPLVVHKFSEKAKRQMLDAQQGRKTPKQARDPEDHPLHHRFEWDDAKAGHAYRVSQAAELIRTVKVVYDSGPREKWVRAFVSVRPEGARRGAYIPIEKVAQDPIASAVLKSQMNREWKAFKARYEHMAEFLELLKAEVEAA